MKRHDLVRHPLPAPLVGSSLVELVKKIGRGNLHYEIDFGSPIGHEVW